MNYYVCNSGVDNVDTHDFWHDDYCKHAYYGAYIYDYFVDGRACHAFSRAVSGAYYGDHRDGYCETYYCVIYGLYLNKSDYFFQP